jgi:hypothetical protein
VACWYGVASETCAWTREETGDGGEQDADELHVVEVMETVSSDREERSERRQRTN